MNEKRFIVIDDNFSRWVVDTSLKEDKHEGTLYNVYDMCNKLNELVEENEHLRQVNNDFEKLFSETISIADTSQLLETGNYDIKRMFVKELVDSLMSENEQLRQINEDKNGYNEISCPICNSKLIYSRQVAYPNGEVYFEFDCNNCDFTGRIQKGDLYE